MRRSLRFFSSRIFGKHRWVNSGARRRKDGVSRFWISRQTKTVKTNTTPEKKAQPGESTSGDWAYTDTMLGVQNGNPCAGINRHEVSCVVIDPRHAWKLRAREPGDLQGVS